MDPKKTNINEFVRERVTKAAEEYLNGIDTKIKSMMDQSIASLLGLSSEYRGYEIDHCNGRNSILQDIIREKAKKEVEQVVKGFSFANLDKSLVLESFRKEFKSHVDYAVKDQAVNKAREFVRVLVENITQAELKKMGYDTPEKVK